MNATDGSAAALTVGADMCAPALVRRRTIAQVAEGVRYAQDAV